MSKTTNITGFGSGGTYDTTSVDVTDVGYKAGGAITVGMAVMIDKSDKTGKTVIAATDADKLLMCGVYQGEGGSGAQSADAVLAGVGTGKAAASGDPIYVRVSGFCKVVGKPFATSGLLTPPVMLTPNLTSGGFVQEVTGLSSTAFMLGWPLVSVSSGNNTTSVSTAVMGCIARFM